MFSRTMIRITAASIMAIIGVFAHAQPFDGQLTLYDDTTGDLIDIVPITGEITLSTSRLLVDDVVIDGSLMQFSPIFSSTEGRTLFSTLETATVGPGQLGFSSTVDWKGSASNFINIWKSFYAGTGLMYFPVILPGGNAPGGLISPGIRASILVGGLSLLENVGIDVLGGNIQECSETGGSTVSLHADYGVVESVTVDWMIDGTYVGTGDDISIFLSLGIYEISATFTADFGEPETVITSVTVTDTTAPQLNAAFMQNGSVVTSIPVNTMGTVEIDLDVSDVCDPAPTVSASLSQVHMVNDGDILPIMPDGDRVELLTTSVKLSATARDASGKVILDEAVLDIEY